MTKIVSSVYWITGYSFWFGEWKGKRIRSCWKASLMAAWRRSAASTKMRGERGSPYRTPHLQWNCRPGVPLSSTDDLPEEKMHRIQLIHFSLNPMLFIILVMASCSIVSNALAKSSFRSIISCLECWHWYMYSYAHARQSWIVLPFRNPYWLWCTILSMTFCKRLARIFVMTLRQQFKSVIGL